MRIIAGKYRGRQLKSPPSAQTRPTSDRLRETLFNVLAPRIEGVRFLDLCAGTGAVGIEALSRGAEHVTFVDKSRKMCALIEANTSTLGIDAEEFEIVSADASDFVRRHAKKEREPFDMIFYDPPYAESYEIVNLISDTGGQLLTEDAVVIVEHHKKKELPEAFGTLRRFRTLKQGDSVLSFYKPAA
ncbi:MAG TPA: 16S rRNA (guanine(966)-N(2))-methyltransferase RsmD [Pyrinomonadaceae bacterium]|nr:16S rRNA (guanine(966)-N(2))-methyltransferase RsmD [Pyrinomonadaceae bacterium]